MEAGLARFPELGDNPAVRQYGSWAFLPLVARGTAVGALSFAFAAPRAFAASDRAFALALSQHCATALERAELLEREQTARRDAETARRAAEAASRAKSEFLAVMSLELRTPLNAISGYAQLLEMGLRRPVTAEQHEDLARIQRSQRHLLALINDVLNYAKIEAGRVEYEILDVPVARLLDTVGELVAPQIRDKGLTYDSRVAGPAGLAVRADEEKARQVLLNLLSNAVKFTSRGGAIRVSAEPQGDRILVRVTDTGVGIPADQLERVFEPFVQVQRGLTRVADGTGLGLAISRDLAHGMGGDLTVTSRVGAGSAFTLALPRP